MIRILDRRRNGQHLCRICGRHADVVVGAERGSVKTRICFRCVDAMFDAMDNYITMEPSVVLDETKEG